MASDLEMDDILASCTNDELLSLDKPAVPPAPLSIEKPVVRPTPLSMEKPAVPPTPLSMEKPAITPTPLQPDQLTSPPGAGASSVLCENFSGPVMSITSAAGDLLEQLRAIIAGGREPSVRPGPQLNSFNLEGVAEHIKSGKCKNIIFMTGAGLSTAAGIPDFRSPNTGLYDQLQKYNLSSPQEIFSIDFFRENPKPFYELAKELYPGKFIPTVSHYFIRLLSEKGLLLRSYTQNIDTLERIAGVPGDKIIEAHGSFSQAHCIQCNEEYSQDWLKEKVFADEIPTCTVCDGYVKPDIVFFGEGLPKEFHTGVVTDFPVCDLLIIMGTSLVVQPFAHLVGRVGHECPRLLINREEAGKSRLGGLEFGEECNYRDVFHQCDCDDGCMELAELLGWKNELLELVAHEQAKLAAENSTTGTDSEAASAAAAVAPVTGEIPASGTAAEQASTPPSPAGAGAASTAEGASPNGSPPQENMIGDGGMASSQ